MIDAYRGVIPATQAVPDGPDGQDHWKPETERVLPSATVPAVCLNVDSWRKTARGFGTAGMGIRRVRLRPSSERSRRTWCTPAQGNDAKVRITCHTKRKREITFLQITGSAASLGTWPPAAAEPRRRAQQKRSQRPREWELGTVGTGAGIRRSAIRMSSGITGLVARAASRAFLSGVKLYVLRRCELS